MIGKTITAGLPPDAVTAWLGEIDNPGFDAFEVTLHDEDYGRYDMSGLDNLLRAAIEGAAKLAITRDQARISGSILYQQYYPQVTSFEWRRYHHD